MDQMDYGAVLPPSLMVFFNNCGLIAALTVATPIHASEHASNLNMLLKSSSLTDSNGEG